MLGDPQRKPEKKIKLTTISFWTLKLIFSVCFWIKNALLILFKSQYYGFSAQSEWDCYKKGFWLVIDCFGKDSNNKLCVVFVNFK